MYYFIASFEEELINPIFFLITNEKKTSLINCYCVTKLWHIKWYNNRQAIAYFNISSTPPTCNAEFQLKYFQFRAVKYFRCPSSTPGSYLCYLFEMFIAFQVQSVRHRRFYQKIMTNWILVVCTGVHYLYFLLLSS